MTDEPSPDLAKRAGERLRNRADLLIGRRPITCGCIAVDLTRLADVGLLHCIDRELRAALERKQPAIYAFIAQDPESYGRLAAAFVERPRTDAASGAVLSYSRLNAHADYNALYVGSGRDLAGRVGQHLGRIGGAGTFAMRLASWATDVAAMIDLRYWSYPAELSAIELEVLEQELWLELTPLLGKQSGK